MEAPICNKPVDNTPHPTPLVGSEAVQPPSRCFHTYLASAPSNFALQACLPSDRGEGTRAESQARRSESKIPAHQSLTLSSALEMASSPR